MITDESGGSRWYSAHLFRFNHKAVGRTEEDVRKSFQVAKGKGNAVVKMYGLPLGEEAGQSINKTETWMLKFKEVTTKLSTVIPVIAGLTFLSNAYTMLRESSGQAAEVATAGVLGVIGLAAITLLPIIAFESGRAYGLMHKWAKDNNLTQVFQSETFWQGGRGSGRR
jgi:hypothetical protein